MSYHSKTQWSEESKKFLQTKKVVDIFKGKTTRKSQGFQLKKSDKNKFANLKLFQFVNVIACQKSGRVGNTGKCGKRQSLSLKL